MVEAIINAFEIFKNQQTEVWVVKHGKYWRGYVFNADTKEILFKGKRGGLFYDALKFLRDSLIDLNKENKEMRSCG